jgi:DNA-binding transcriptional LysR family regulator
MDLNDILVFTKVVETRSFTGAAEVLGLPKSTVSRKLAQLEERLGVRLVQRTTRKLSLTEIGQTYYERCAQIVADVAAAEQLVTDMQTTPRGRVRLTAPIDFSTRYLGAICADFGALYPDVTIELEASDRMVDLIEEGFDLAVRFGALSESTLIARRLCRIDSLLVATPAYLARRGTPMGIEDIEEHERVLFAPNARVQSWALIHGETTYEFGRPARFASNNVGAVRDAVLAGAGISVLATFMVADDIAAGRLVALLPEWRGRQVDAHAIYPARQNLPPRLSLFIDHLAKALDPVPWATPGAGGGGSGGSGAGSGSSGGGGGGGGGDPT